MPPEMIVIAGPSGSGKSSHFGVRSFGVAFFNVDDRCAELNRGSYADKLPRLVRVYNQQRIVFDDPPVPPWLATALSLA